MKFDREEGGQMLLPNQMVIQVKGSTFSFVSEKGLPVAASSNPVFQIVADWDEIDTRFDQITIFDFKPVKPTNYANGDTLKRNGKFISTLVFRGVSDVTGVKFSLEFSGKETLTIDPGMVLKP